MVKNNIPEEIINRIIMNVASLKAADKTWKKIHNYIKTKTLHLKLTKYVYKFNMKYEKIKRISTIVFYRSSPYTWTKSSTSVIHTYFKKDSMQNV